MRQKQPFTRALRVALVAVFALGAACGKEKPPQPGDVPEQPASAAASGGAQGGADAELATFDPAKDRAVYTFAGDRGRFQDVGDVATIPEEAKGLVRVVVPGGVSPPAGHVFVANLREPLEGGRFALRPVPRDLFEELALGQGRSSKVQLPEGLQPPPPAPPAPSGEIVVYKTEWCGVCKQLTRYLDKKGAKYVAKDIEKDPSAAAELQAKARKAGLRSNSVPIVDLGGELMVGFDRKRLEKHLGS